MYPFDFTAQEWAGVGIFAAVAYFIILLARVGSRPDYEKETESCKVSEGAHFEDDTLGSVLTVGQTYRTVHSRKTKRCDGSGDFYLAWLEFSTESACCAYDELVAFEAKPPDFFIYAANGKVVEVHPDEYSRTATVGDQEVRSWDSFAGRMCEETVPPEAATCEVRH